MAANRSREDVPDEPDALQAAGMCGAPNSPKGNARFKFCHRWALEGKTRCGRHGGRNPSGPAHPNYKTGQHSRHWMDQVGDMAARIEEALSNEHLLKLDPEIATVDVAIGEAMKRLGSTPDPVTWAELAKAVRSLRSSIDDADGASILGNLQTLESIVASAVDYDRAWNRVEKLQDHRRKLVRDEVRNRAAEHGMVATTAVALMLNEILALVMATFGPYRDEIRAFAAGLDRIARSSSGLRLGGDPG